MSLTAFAPAKINLFLHVGAPARDGYHPLCSLMVFADIGDQIVLQDAEALSFRVHGPFAGPLAGEDDNLVLRAAKALFAAARGPQPPLCVALEKVLPVAAGLGGGSSDAGATLRVLRSVLGLAVSDEALEAVAASLGADGAACLWGRPVVAEGRGEQLSNAPGLPPIEAVLVNPGVEVSTPAVYRALDEARGFGDVEPPPLPEAFESVVELAAWLGMMRNDLEAPAVGLAPEIGDVLGLLAEEPESLIARMSGSGATCFSICASDIEADALAQRVARLRPQWWVRRCRLGGPWPDA
jgi:4-diphosphocytidyl-2-C-methyl-D-erythritol kinase